MENKLEVGMIPLLVEIPLVLMLNNACALTLNPVKKGDTVAGQILQDRIAT